MTHKRVLFAAVLASLVALNGAAALAQTGEYRRAVHFHCPAGDVTLMMTAPAADGPWNWEDRDQFVALDPGCQLASLADPSKPQATAKRAPARRPAQPPAPAPTLEDQSEPLPSAALTPAVQQHDSSGADVGTVFLLLLLFVLYFVPAFVADRRACKAGAGIFIVNLFLGWTFIGWVVALAWAACGEQLPKSRIAV